MKKQVIALAVVVVAIVVLFNFFTFTVHEQQQAVVSRFGKVSTVIVNDINLVSSSLQDNTRFEGIGVTDRKGLHFKVPFLDTIDYYEARLLTYDTSPREVITLDKKKVILDNYAQWRIVNPLLFRVSIGSKGNAQTRLDDIVYSKINEKVGRTEAHTLISNKDFVASLLEEVTINTNKEFAAYGIEVVDVRIKRTDLPPENYENIFNRMRTERERQARQYRSEGQEEAQKIRSEAEKQATIIEAEAYAQAERIKGAGEAEALRIYAEAYGQDVEFYEFYRTLDAYRKTINKDTTIVIDSNSPFAKYLFGGN